MLLSREYSNVYIKDEGLNPTGSFKARGLSACVTMARHFGSKKLAIPSAGNAAGALGSLLYSPLESKRTSSCREMSPWPTASSATTTARTSPWSTA